MDIEILDLSDIEFRSPDDIEGFICVEDTIIYYDSEKGITENRAILKRISDNKLFKLLYTNWGTGILEINSTKCKEVFRREEIKVSYY